MNTLSYIEQKITSARELDFGTIFSQSIDLFKKTWLQGLIMQLFVLAISIPFIIIFYIPFILMLIADAESGGYDTHVMNSYLAGLSILYLIFFFVCILVLSAVSVALNAALYRIIREIDKGNQVITSDFFYFLKGKYLSKAFLLVMFSILISIPAVFLCYIPFLYLIVPLTLFAVIFAFNPELGVTDIIKVSFKLGNKKWLLIFGLVIVASMLASIVGFLLCGIGTLVTAAFVYHPTYIVYKEVVGFEDNDEIETIGRIEE